MSISRKLHWETVYETKNADQVSWTEDRPNTSLDFINAFDLDKSAKIIDIGGGDSKLVDYLLAEGFENITVLDISAKALEKAQTRLGDLAKKVNWKICDITNFQPESKYDIWHDRAVFHFLIDKEDIEKYTNTASYATNSYLVIGTFSEDGPLKCSGLEISHYSEEKLENIFSKNFEKISCQTLNHCTPFNTLQNFLYCSFKKKKKLG